ncbi:YafY family transcriptional regulator [Oxalobacteraceae bacterium]|nr:YafY family transcriptional regulator [Oxalobacteraceae bacterium]
MSRAQRLLDLIQILRRHRFPLTGQALALELGISVRTLYRDIGTLQEQGARIEGEPGLGYVLRPGFMLPPLMFSEEELEALVLGSRWVASRADSRLGSAARDALAKISAVLPVELRHSLDCSTLLVGPNAPGEEEGGQLPILRSAIRTERKIAITYLDLKGAESTRTVWPIALSFFDEVRVLVAWCELRQTFRNFRADRISSLSVSDERYPRGRQTILREWRAQEGIPAQ